MDTQRDGEAAINGRGTFLEIGDRETQRATTDRVYLGAPRIRQTKQTNVYWLLVSTARLPRRVLSLATHPHLRRQDCLVQIKE